MHKRAQGTIAGLFVVLICWCLLGVTSAATAATAADGLTCPQTLLPAQVKTLAKSVAATTTGQGGISGRVTEKGTPNGIANVDVMAMGVGLCTANYGTATTDANGNYTISGLTGGTYQVEFTPPNATPYYIPQWYNGVLTMTQAAAVQVTEPNTTPNINANLERGGSISGVVSTSDSGLPISITVTASGTKGGSGSTSLGYDGTGSYTITGLATDSYTVSFKSPGISIPPFTSYASKDYPNNPVAVTAPGETKNINITLSPGGSITGTVTDPSGNPLNQIFVTAQQAGAVSVGTGFTDTHGIFTIGGLPSGTYEVVTNRYNATAYLPGKKTGVVVVAPDTNNIGTIQLQLGGQITGTVKNYLGAPLSGVYAGAYDATTGVFVNTATTVADGAYTINSLDTGSYKVEFFICQGGYVTQWYNHKTSQATADPVSVTKPNIVHNIDATLDLQSSGYGVIYNGNGSTGGTVPVDGNSYATGATVTVLGAGTLSRTGYAFNGWNTVANGSGARYDAGNTYTMGTASIAFYAQWTPQATYTVTYSGNGSTGGAVPVDANSYLQGATVTVLGAGTLTRTGYTFNGWNTVANGSGARYDAGNTYTMGTANITFYAQWTPQATYTVTYSGNSSTGGAVPVDGNSYATGATVTVLGAGTLTRTGYTFKGWNTAANGSGASYVAGNTYTMGTASITFYAQWTSTSAITKGDVNSDGIVNVFDALLTLQYAVGLIEHTPENITKYLAVADVAPLGTDGKPKGDGVVNVFDALAILRHAVSLDPW